ncbi:PREDICTED: uncharacterized protein LOC106821327 [Priapulus caudatus]|uniref:Uncharacterized protein LOC106821327 n=1 Tax=Priapulus caudatus TaxID=37621 RepID=A0ABM1FAU9_PRICU|nr:PREDICTED: uncharacterized protein LOC106821327 [Priapulus caudatus]
MNTHCTLISQVSRGNNVDGRPGSLSYITGNTASSSSTSIGSGPCSTSGTTTTTGTNPSLGRATDRVITCYNSEPFHVGKVMERKINRKPETTSCKQVSLRRIQPSRINNDSDTKSNQPTIGARQALVSRIEHCLDLQTVVVGTTCSTSRLKNNLTTVASTEMFSDSVTEVAQTDLSAWVACEAVHDTPYINEDGESSEQMSPSIFSKEPSEMAETIISGTLNEQDHEGHVLSNITKDNAQSTLVSSSDLLNRVSPILSKTSNCPDTESSELLTKRERDRKRKAQQRSNPAYKAREKERERARMAWKRNADSLFRETERIKDRERRRESREKNCAQRIKEQLRDRLWKRQRYEKGKLQRKLIHSTTDVTALTTLASADSTSDSAVVHSPLICLPILQVAPLVRWQATACNVDVSPRMHDSNCNNVDNVVVSSAGGDAITGPDD